ncbi:MAG: HlyC/CorC family transporter [Myxococcales bacterium]|nr:HlyC/CorC family transporter [Myxococcales bacterium]MCB9752434.1 HlyC/CorC family transporter [Myxococcales bacterium]
MDDTDAFQVLVVALCVIGSMFFSGSETAITSLDVHRARRVVEEGGRRGRLMEFWVNHPVRVLSTILVGNNITNTLMGALVTALAIRHLNGGPYGEYAVGGAVVLTTILLLIFGEITPKAIGRAYSEQLSLPALGVLSALSRVMSPALWLLTRITNFVLKRFTGGGNLSLSSPVTSDEIGYLVKVGRSQGSINADQAALLRRIVSFEDKIVRDIMVPVDNVTAVDLEWDARQVREVAIRSGHSRLPVYQGNVDSIRGILHIKQLVGLADQETIERILRPPVFVSESQRLHDVLRRFKEQRVHLGIVVDDAGDTVGVITLEDVLEQIVGQIFDESDRAPLRSGPEQQDGVYYFHGQDSLTRVEERLKIEEFEELEGVDSIGDLLTRLAGQIPIAGSVFVWENIRFKVLAADDRHVIRVSVERVEPTIEVNPASE